jgi:hypothetical protein
MNILFHGKLDVNISKVYKSFTNGQKTGIGALRQSIMPGAY